VSQTIAGPKPPGRALAGWVLYDMALHGYVLIIPSVAYAIYFTTFIAAGHGQAKLLWSLAVALPLLLAGLLGPLIGAFVDAHAGMHRRLLLAATGLCGLATAALALPRQGDIALSLALFGIAHLACMLATALYNAHLPCLSTPATSARVSALGWGLSYLGSIACFVLTLPFISGGIAQPGQTNQFAWSFVVAGAFVGLVGLPAAWLLPAGDASQTKSRGALLPELAATLRGWRQRPEIPRFLLGFYLINDAVVTTVYFTAIFLHESFGLSVQQVLRYSLAFHLIAIPATLAFGWLGDRWGQHKALNLSLGLWVAVLALMWLASGPWAPLAIVAGLGLVLGSTQSLCRSLFSRMLPPEQAGEYFGFHAMAGRTSSALGPLMFAGMAVLTGNQRVAMASLAIFLLAGGWLIHRAKQAQQLT
jgi:UMF1 family MFS transporter